VPIHPRRPSSSSSLFSSFKIFFLFLLHPKFRELLTETWKLIGNFRVIVSVYVGETSNPIGKKNGATDKDDEMFHIKAVPLLLAFRVFWWWQRSGNQVEEEDH
jgi:hypothetical protein